ncbi:MAG: hypothetical protein AAFR38_02375 [Planctomycetota bacterium]
MQDVVVLVLIEPDSLGSLPDVMRTARAHAPSTVVWVYKHGAAHKLTALEADERLRLEDEGEMRASTGSGPVLRYVPGERAEDEPEAALQHPSGDDDESDLTDEEIDLLLTEHPDPPEDH